MDVYTWSVLLSLGVTAIYAVRLGRAKDRNADLEDCIARLCNSYGKGSMHEDELQRAWKLLDK